VPNIEAIILLKSPPVPAYSTEDHAAALLLASEKGGPVPGNALTEPSNEELSSSSKADALALAPRRLLPDTWSDACMLPSRGYAFSVSGPEADRASSSGSTSGLLDRLVAEQSGRAGGNEMHAAAGACTVLCGTRDGRLHVHRIAVHRKIAAKPSVSLLGGTDPSSHGALHAGVVPAHLAVLQDLECSLDMRRGISWPWSFTGLRAQNT